MHSDFEEDAVVEEGRETLARSELAALVLLLNALFAAHLAHGFAPSFEVLDQFTHVHGDIPD